MLNGVGQGSCTRRVEGADEVEVEGEAQVKSHSVLHSFSSSLDAFAYGVPPPDIEAEDRSLASTAAKGGLKDRVELRWEGDDAAETEEDEEEWEETEVEEARRSVQTTVPVSNECRR